MSEVLGGSTFFLMSSTITKADLANTLFDELGLNKREAKEFVELFFEKFREALEGGESVDLAASPSARKTAALAAIQKPGKPFPLARVE